MQEALISGTAPGNALQELMEVEEADNLEFQVAYAKRIQSRIWLLSGAIVMFVLIRCPDGDGPQLHEGFVAKVLDFCCCTQVHHLTPPQGSRNAA